MLDHGVLNIPLYKRMGSIDAQLDRYKSDEARKAKKERSLAAAEKKVKVERAKVVVANMSEETVGRLASKAGLTLCQARKKLDSMAFWQPDLVLKMEGKG